MSHFTGTVANPDSIPMLATLVAVVRKMLKGSDGVGAEPLQDGAADAAKVPLIAAIETSNEGRPLRMVLCQAKTFRLDEAQGWERHSLTAGATVASDDLVRFEAVEAAGYSRRGTENKTKTPATVLRLAEMQYRFNRFNRRFYLSAILNYLLYISVLTGRRTESRIRLTENQR